MEWEGWEVGRVDSDEVKDRQEGDVLYPLGVRRKKGEELPHRVLRQCWDRRTILVGPRTRDSSVESIILGGTGVKEV